MLLIVVFIIVSCIHFPALAASIDALIADRFVKVEISFISFNVFLFLPLPLIMF